MSAIDCTTCGVTAAHGSLPAGVGDDFLAGDAVDALAGRVGDVPDVGHLDAGLLPRGDDIAAQRVVGLVARLGRDRDALRRDGGAQLRMDLLGDRVRRTDNGRDGNLGLRGLRRCSR